MSRKGKFMNNKEIMSKNIRYYLKLKNKNAMDLVRDLNLKQPTVSSWMNGDTYPRIDKIEMLANYFNIDKSDLVEDRSKRDVIATSSINVMTRKVPVYGSIPAGTPLEAIEDRIDDVYVPNFLDKKKDLFGLLVSGDSMNLVLPNGFIAIFQKQDHIENGEIGAFLIDNANATIKQFHKLSNMIVLEPLTTNKENNGPIIINEDQELRVLGKLVWSCAPKNFY